MTFDITVGSNSAFLLEGGGGKSITRRTKPTHCTTWNMEYLFRYLDKYYMVISSASTKVYDIVTGQRSKV